MMNSLSLLNYLSTDLNETAVYADIDINEELVIHRSQDFKKTTETGKQPEEVLLRLGTDILLAKRTSQTLFFLRNIFQHTFFFLETTNLFYESTMNNKN